MAEAGLTPGRVSRVDRGYCDVVIDDPSGVGVATVRAAMAPVFDPDPVCRPCTGDWVAVDFGAAPALAALLPRRTAIVRGSAGRESSGQALAVNVEAAMIVISLAVKLDIGRLERFLALVWESGAEPIVVLTKADVGLEPDVVAEAEAASPGATVLAVSALDGYGMAELRSRLPASTALIGASGAGKSTLTNALAGAQVMAVRATRERDGKGRHTTTARELIPLPGGGVLIDTPGLRGIAMFGADEGIDRTFPDIEELAGQCRFSDCSHDTEPGCAVTAAIESGALPSRRLESYRKLLREQEWMASRTDARLAAQRLRHWQALAREAGPARP
jgi:ribosome biogenesis GTPase